jgi:transposase
VSDLNSSDLPDDVEALRKLVVEMQSTIGEKQSAIDGKQSVIDAKQFVIDEKQSIIDAKQFVIDEKQAVIDRLEEWVRLLRSQKFGRSSERGIDPMQPGLFNEAEVSCEDVESTEPEAVEVPSHTRRRKGRAPLPAALERVEILHDLPEEKKSCPHDGHALERIGEERSEQLEIIPAAAHVLVHVRPKYACPHCHEGVTTAPMPPQPIPKSIASPGLLSFVTVSKYADGLPLYRLEGILERCGVDLPRSTLSSWMIRAGDLVQPLLNLLRDEMHDYGFLQCDETPFQVLKEPGRKPTTKSYLWAQRGGPRDRPIVLYDYAPSRGTEVPLSLLEGYEGGLQTDGYVVYDEVASKYGLRHYGCWAHARRKFVDALKGQKSKKDKKKSPKSAKAEQALRFIERLYEIEKAGRELADEDRRRLR